MVLAFGVVMAFLAIERPTSCCQVRGYLGAGRDQSFHGLNRLLEHRALCGIKIDLNDPLDAVAADHHRHTHIEPLYPVLAAEIGGTRQYPAFVFEVALSHLNGRGSRRIESR